MKKPIRRRKAFVVHRRRYAPLPPQKRINAAHLWRDIEDHAAPKLDLSLTERAVYFHFIRRAFLDGKNPLRFSLSALVRQTSACSTGIGAAIRALALKRAVRILERTGRGHIVEVRTPRMIPFCVPAPQTREVRRIALELLPILTRKEWRKSIFLRENGRCFYCLRKLRWRITVFDHVLPRARGGDDSYRNIVAVCFDCNAKKGKTPVRKFLRLLLRDDILTSKEFKQRRTALNRLLRGKLKPVLPMKLRNLS